MSASLKFDGWTTAEEAAAALASEIRGKTVLITGASPGGLGAETARVIAKYAKLTIIAGRSLPKLKEAEALIEKETPDANLRLLVIDLADFASVRKAAEEVNAYTEPLDVLINNAAVMKLPSYTTLPGTSIETQFGTNHLGPFLFTNLVKPRLAASSSPRVVNVASSGHRTSGIREGGSFGEKGEHYTGDLAYGQSKTANMLFTISLADKWKDIDATSFSLHPGVIATNLGRHLGVQDYLKLFGLFGYMIYDKWRTGQLKGAPLVMKTIPQGSSTTIVAAFDPSIADQSGSYLCDAAIHNERALAWAKDKNEAERLWHLSEVLIGQQFPVSAKL